jgi:hypothetical protein
MNNNNIIILALSGHWWILRLFAVSKSPKEASIPGYTPTPSGGGSGSGGKKQLSFDEVLSID